MVTGKKILHTLDNKEIDLADFEIEEKKTYMCCGKQLIRISVWDRLAYPQGDWSAYCWCKTCRKLYRIKFNNEDKMWAIDGIKVASGKEVDKISLKKIKKLKSTK